MKRFIKNFLLLVLITSVSFISGCDEVELQKQINSITEENERLSEELAKAKLDKLATQLIESNVVITVGDTFNPLDYVSTTDADKEGVEVTAVSNDVNPDVPGTYNVTYSLEDNSGNESTIIINVKVKKKDPSVNISNIVLDNENMSFDLEIIQNDNELVDIIIYLVDGNDSIVDEKYLENENIESTNKITFDGLNSNYVYNIKTVLKYSEYSEEIIQETTHATTEKAIPIVTLTNINKSTSSLTFDLDVLDSDSVITNIIAGLYKDNVLIDEIIIDSDYTNNQFNNLDDNCDYTIKIKTNYDLNDTNGVISSEDSYETYTLPDIISLLGIGATTEIVTVDDSINLIINLNNETDIQIISVVVNGILYTGFVDGSTNSRIVIEVSTGNEIGNKNYTIQNINVLYNETSGTYEFSENNSIDVFVFDEVLVNNITTNLSEDYADFSTEVILTIDLINPNNYTIDSIVVGEQRYYSSDFITNTENQISFSKTLSYSPGVETITISEVEYSYNGLIINSEIKAPDNEVYIFVGDTTNINYINTVEDLQNMDLDGINILNSNIDLSGIEWNPIGDFQGYFNGNGYTISNLTISKEINDSSSTYWGLFGNVGLKGFITNVNLDNVLIEVLNINDGRMYLGGLTGYNYGIINNTNVTGYITGNSKGDCFIGGLVGSNRSVSINNSNAEVDISSFSDSNINLYVGGLVGNNWWGTINNSYATGDVSIIIYSSNSYNYAGGLVGSNDYGIINDSFATGKISSVSYIDDFTRCSLGGLVGSNRGTINNSYATGDASSSNNNSYNYSTVGGLVGGNDGAINNSFALGDVTSSDCAGGLVGFNGGIVNNSFAIGNINGFNIAKQFGGLIGRYNSHLSEVNNSYRYAKQIIKQNGIIIDSYDLNHPGIFTAINTDLNNLTWYIDSLQLDENIWDLSEVSNGYFPKLIGVEGQIDNSLPIE